MTIHNPVQVYSFTDFSIARPSMQQPGDRLDAQFQNHAAVLNEIIATLLTTAQRLVTANDLDPNLFNDFYNQIITAITPDIEVATTAATQTTSDRITVSTLALQAAIDAARTAGQAAHVDDAAAGLINNLNQQAAAAEVATNKVNALADEVDNYANDAEYWANLASNYGAVCMAWAEYMPGTIPPNILAVMGVTGDHWSSRWWANQAAQSVADIGNSVAICLNAAQQAAASAAEAAASASGASAIFHSMQSYYLGGKPADPVADNNGQVLVNGAMYFNTALGVMRVFNLGAWEDVAAGGGGAGLPDAPVDGEYYARLNGAWVSFTTYQPGVPEAPTDGRQYGRQNGQWSVVVTGSVDWSLINNKPATFPPSPHTHAIADVTGLQTALNAEASIRSATDTSLQASIDLKAPLADPALTGNARSSAPPAADASARIAVTAWVQGELSTFAAQVNAFFMPIGGGAFTGPIALSGDPTAPLQPATKQYTDLFLKSSGAVVAGHFATWQNGLGLVDGGVKAAIANSGSWADLGNIPTPLLVIGALVPAADQLPYFAGPAAAGLTTLSPFGRSLIDDADAAAARVTLVAEQLGKVNAVTTMTAAGNVAVAGHAGAVVELNNAAANTYTINAGVFTARDRFDLCQIGAGQTTIVAGAGVTLHSKNGLKLVGQWSACSFYARANDELVLFGDLTT